MTNVTIVLAAKLRSKRLSPDARHQRRSRKFNHSNEGRDVNKGCRWGMPGMKFQAKREEEERRRWKESICLLPSPWVWKRREIRPQNYCPFSLTFFHVASPHFIQRLKGDAMRHSSSRYTCTVNSKRENDSRERNRGGERNLVIYPLFFLLFSLLKEMKGNFVMTLQSLCVFCSLLSFMQSFLDTDTGRKWREYWSRHESGRDS